MTGPVTPRWEWRCFGVAEDPFSARVPERIEESDELYLLSRESEASVKVRDGLVDVKHRLEVDAGGLELWTPVLKEPFPLSAADAGLVLATLRASGPPLGRSAARWTSSSERAPTCARSRCTSGARATASTAAWPS